MHKKPVLAKKSLIRLALVFYGKRFTKKQIKFEYDKSLSRLTPPYVVVANHSSFADVGCLIRLMYPHCANFVISETQLVKWPKLINKMGVLPKKQFSVDLGLLSDIRYCLAKGRPVVIYPEAKLSVVGVQNIIKPAIAKMVKMFKVPLVTVCFHGSYLHNPRWAKSKRFVPVKADIKLAVNSGELASMPVEEIHRRIVANLTYDDYAYQLENKIKINVPDLVEGLEHILYKCPNCGAEFQMSASGNRLTCGKCGQSVTQNEYGALEGGKFDKVVDWYHWQEDCVREELQNGTYNYAQTFMAQELVKKKYVDLGAARVVHDDNGITVTIDNGEVLQYPKGMFYTLSFNNDYIYLPTSIAVYRLKRLMEVGCTTKLNIGVEQQTKLNEHK